jgi:hypothetical protein
MSPVARRAHTTNTDHAFPSAFADWLAANGDLLDALQALRRLRSEGAEAVEALLGVRRVAALRASWALWQALIEGDGEEPEDLLLKVVPLGVVEEARKALWGPSWRDGHSLEPAQPLASA